MSTYFTDDHEWIEVKGETATVGITDHAAEQLGEIVFVEVKNAGSKVAKGEEFGTIESVKAASEVFAPVDGEVTEINGELDANPGLINESAQDRGWLCRIKLTDTTQLDGMMDQAAYQKLIAD